MIRYESTVKARHWVHYLALTVTTAIVVWLSALYSIAWAFILGYPIVRGWWCVITDRRWRTTVGDGRIVWDRLFSRRQRVIEISDIAKIELERGSEEGTSFYFRMTNGKRQAFRGHMLLAQEEYPKMMAALFAALVAEKPEIEITGVHASGFTLLPIDTVVAVDWTHDEAGKPRYGAEVLLLPAGERYSVRCRVFNWRGRDSWHEKGELGTVAGQEEAEAKWGQIAWSNVGLTIGPGDPEPFFLPISEVEPDR